MAQTPARSASPGPEFSSEVPHWRAAEARGPAAPAPAAHKGKDIDRRYTRSVGKGCTNPTCVAAKKTHTHSFEECCFPGGGRGLVENGGTGDTSPCSNPYCVSRGRQHTHILHTCLEEGGHGHARKLGLPLVFYTGAEVPAGPLPRANKYCTNPVCVATNKHRHHTADRCRVPMPVHAGSSSSSGGGGGGGDGGGGGGDAAPEAQALYAAPDAAALLLLRSLLVGVGYADGLALIVDAAEAAREAAAEAAARAPTAAPSAAPESSPGTLRGAQRRRSPLAAQAAAAAAAAAAARGSGLQPS